MKAIQKCSAKPLIEVLLLLSSIPCYVLGITLKFNIKVQILSRRQIWGLSPSALSKYLTMVNFLNCFHRELKVKFELILLAEFNDYLFLSNEGGVAGGRPSP